MTPGELSGRRKALWLKHQSTRVWLERVLALLRVSEGLDRWADDGGQHDTRDE